MTSSAPPTAPTCTITETEKGWLLSISNDDCSVVQVFRTASDARLALDRMMDFFETMSTQPPGTVQAA